MLSSCGELITRWLEGIGSAAEFAAQLMESDAGCSGFHMVLGNLQCNAWT